MRPLAVMLVLLAVARPSLAQSVVVPSEARPVVTGFAPPSGPPGSVVTLSGRGFGPGLRVLLGGRAATIDFMSSSTVQFHVPPLPPGVLPITVQAPGVADVEIGTFMVAAQLVVAAFAPGSGPPGTRVEIRGGFFERGDVVTLGAMRLPVIEGSRSRLIVAVPAGAPSDVFVVTRPATGARAVSARRFTVTRGAAPFVTSVEPAAGPPGTTVRIRGGNFGPEDTVSYGARPLAIADRGDDFVDVVVPPDARASEPFVVHGARGEARAPFELTRVAITGFTPDAGPPGTRVEIAGVGFAADDEVRLGAQPLTVVSADAHRLVALIPDGATSDVLNLVRQHRRVVATSAQPFRVVAPAGPPVLTGFTPPGGAPGTEVTLTGQGLGPDVRVSYDDLALPIYGRTGDTAIIVRVPRGATRSAPFVVATRHGETRSGAWFQLALAPAIDSVTPTSGPPGTEVMVSGRLRGDESFFLSGEPMAVVERLPGGARLTVPAAPSGVISLEADGRRVDTPFRFDVLARLAVTGFAPMIGPPGTRVALRGDNLASVERVGYGGLPCPIVRRGRGELVVEIPPEAAGADHFWVEAAGQRARSAERFTVALAAGGPTLGAFTPGSGPPGTQVVLAASGFGPGATVWLAGRECPVVQRAADALVVVVPEGASGRSGFTVIDDDGKRHHTAQQFEVVLGRQSPF